MDAKEAGKYIQAQRKRAGLTQDQVVEKTTVPTPQYLSALENGRYDVRNSEHFRSLAELYSLSEEEIKELKPDAVIIVHRGPISPVPEDNASAEILNIRPVLIRNLAAAGTAFYSDESLGVAYVEERLYRPDMEVVRVSGESMSPTLKEGDEVYIDTHQLDPQNGKIFLLHVEGQGYLLKRAALLSKQWLLMSDNPRYPPITLHEARIIGRAYHRKAGNDL